jgi:hypothetical protein
LIGFQYIGKYGAPFHSEHKPPDGVALDKALIAIAVTVEPVMRGRFYQSVPVSMQNNKMHSTAVRLAAPLSGFGSCIIC